MNRDRLRAVGPWKEEKLSDAAEPRVSLTEGEASTRDWAGTPDSSDLAQVTPRPLGTPSVNDPVMTLVAEMIDANAQVLEEMARVLRGDAERVRKLG